MSQSKKKPFVLDSTLIVERDQTVIKLMRDEHF